MKLTESKKYLDVDEKTAKILGNSDTLISNGILFILKKNIFEMFHLGSFSFINLKIFGPVISNYFLFIYSDVLTFNNYSKIGLTNNSNEIFSENNYYYVVPILMAHCNSGQFYNKTQ